MFVAISSKNPKGRSAASAFVAVVAVRANPGPGRSIRSNGAERPQKHHFWPFQAANRFRESMRMKHDRGFISSDLQMFERFLVSHFQLPVSKPVRGSSHPSVNLLQAATTGPKWSQATIVPSRTSPSHRRARNKHDQYEQRSVFKKNKTSRSDMVSVVFLVTPKQ